MKRLALVILIAALLISFVGCAPSAKAGMPVVLLTDYGNDDYRVPRLKGIIYSAYPDVEIIDATHGITGMDIATGAYVLDLAAKEFPADVVFIAGVGSPANPDVQYLVLLTNKDQIFVAANNGLLTNIINDMGIKKAYSITNTELYDRPDSMLSSHYILGRVGALIASGRPLEDVGPEVSNPVMLDIQKAVVASGKAQGSVVFIDRFGNCLTNISGADCAQLGIKVGDTLQVTIAGAKVTMKLGTTYGSVAVGEAVAFVNSLDSLQLSLNSANFAGAYNLKNGAKIEIEKLAP
ncbi:MAG: SAM-dependent chlorinase/fluorinase [Dehalococcoidales bacterium]